MLWSLAQESRHGSLYQKEGLTPLPNPAHRDCLDPVRDRYRAAEEGTFPRHALVGTAFERRFISAQEDQPTFHTALGKTELSSLPCLSSIPTDSAFLKTSSSSSSPCPCLVTPVDLTV